MSICTLTCSKLLFRFRFGTHGLNEDLVYTVLWIIVNLLFVNGNIQHCDRKYEKGSYPIFKNFELYNQWEADVMTIILIPLMYKI